MTEFWRGFVLGGVAVVVVPWLIVLLLALVLKAWVNLQQWRADRRARPGRDAYDAMWERIDQQVHRQARLKEAALNPPKPAFRSIEEIEIEKLFHEAGCSKREIEA